MTSKEVFVKAVLTSECYSCAHMRKYGNSVFVTCKKPDKWVKQQLSELDERNSCHYPKYFNPSWKHNVCMNWELGQNEAKD